MSENLDLKFVLDSAATNHFFKEKTVFPVFQEFKSQAVTAKNTTKIAGIGNSINLVINSGTVGQLKNNNGIKKIFAITL